MLPLVDGGSFRGLAVAENSPMFSLAAISLFYIIVSPFSNTELALALALTGLSVTGESIQTTELELLSMSGR